MYNHSIRNEMMSVQITFHNTVCIKMVEVCV